MRENVFLLSLLPEVNELSETQFKVFKRRVLALLDELDISCLNIVSHAECKDDSLAVSRHISVGLEDTCGNTSSTVKNTQHNEESERETDNN